MDELQGTMPPLTDTLEQSYKKSGALYCRTSCSGADLQLGVEAITHPGHKGLNVTDRQAIISQLQTEMMHVAEQDV